MKQLFHISGMTCNGCRTDVENRLNAIEGVTKAVVTLNNEQAVIDLKTPISMDQFKTVLPEKYKITVKKNVFVNDASSNSEPTPSKLKQLKPLFIILGYITIATMLLNYNRETWDGAMPDFMGLFLIVFSFFKMLDLKGFPESFKMYDPLAKALPYYGWIYPFLETALGILFLMRFEIKIALIVTIVILTITTIGVIKTLRSKKSIQCACLGTALKLPMTQATLIENGIMITMGIVYLLTTII